jgi:hypothetical protein
MTLDEIEKDLNETQASYTAALGRLRDARIEVDTLSDKMARLRQQQLNLLQALVDSTRIGGRKL